MWKSEEEQCAAIRAFLSKAAHGRLEKFWTDKGPTDKAVFYVDKGSPLSSGETLLLNVAFDVWNGSGHATVGDLLTTLDNENLAAVIELMLVARPGARPGEAS